MAGLGVVSLPAALCNRMRKSSTAGVCNSRSWPHCQVYREASGLPLVEQSQVEFIALCKVRVRGQQCRVRKPVAAACCREARPCVSVDQAAGHGPCGAVMR